MLETRRSRVIAVVVLLGGLGVSCIGFGVIEPSIADGRYPYAGHIVQHPDQYVDGPVVVNGEVIDTHPLKVEATYAVVDSGHLDRGGVTFTVTNAPPSSSVGDKIQVYGILQQDRTIRAKRVVVSARNVRYMYTVSALAGLWVLSRLLRQWRFDWQRYAVVPRDDPVGLTDLARRTAIRDTEGESDA